MENPGTEDRWFLLLSLQSSRCALSCCKATALRSRRYLSSWGTEAYGASEAGGEGDWEGAGWGKGGGGGGGKGGGGKADWGKVTLPARF